jgi:hypothetical protein
VPIPPQQKNGRFESPPDGPAPAGHIERKMIRI